MKVIGGEFAIDSTDYLNHKNKIQDAQCFSSGRAALYAILNDIIKQGHQNAGVLLPNYLCDSVTNTVIASGWKYDFYNVGTDLYPDIASVIDRLDRFNVILLINYFGMLDLSQLIAYFKKNFPNTIVILDDVQGYYDTKNIQNTEYRFTSFRKWFPCPDGAEATKLDGSLIDEISRGENIFAQYKFAGNLLKKYVPDVSDELVLKLLSKGEEMLGNNYLCNMSEISKRILSTIDFEKYAETRKNNAKVLHEGLKCMGIAHVYQEDSIPLFVPVFLENRDEVRKHFFKNSIFTPVHWPYAGKDINGINKLYNTELSLICDQRYCVDDMNRQLDLLLEVANKG